MKRKRRKVAKRKEASKPYSHRAYGLYNIVRIRPDGKKVKSVAMWSRRGWTEMDGETRLPYFISKVDEKMLKTKID